MTTENSYKTWQTIAVGDKATMTILVDEKMVKAFAELTGDNNPIHTDPEFAKKTVFRKCVVHGAFQNSLISAILASQMPGPGSIYCSQESTFSAALFVGEKVTVEVEVVEKLMATKQAKIKTTCINESGQITLQGFAVVFPARR
jgi:3-hydroxybutyryl-CoA dehydratase